MRRSLVLFTFLAACSSDPALVAVDAASPDVTAATVASPATPLAQAALDRGIAPLSFDDRGVPRMLRAVTAIAAPASAATPDQAARAHVAALAPVWGLAGQPASALVTGAIVPLDGGATIVALEQRIGGLPLWASRVSVLLDGDRALRAISGVPRSAAGAPAPADFRISAADALAIAAADRFNVQVTATGVASAVSNRDWVHLRARGLGPAQAERALLPVADQLRAVWVVEVFGIGTHAWRVFVDGITGAIVDRNDLTSDAAFAYRVFADNDAAGRPFDGPQVSFDPHPTGVPDGSQPAFVAPNLVTMDGFNSSHDPWLASGATTSLGNNVDAYIDFNDNQDGFTAGTDFRASTTSAGAFDRSYDTASAANASQTQQMAAITNLFYITNWLHDWWYDSGFTEATGNAQQNNYGRGGVAGDPLHAEAQDDLLGGSTDNANMSTPTDGMSPRMQMYVWDGLAPHTLTINPGNLSMVNAGGGFGPQTFDLTNTVVLATPNDACAAITNNVTGKIVLVDRGTCTFVQKATAVQNAGGIGMIVADNGTGVATMGGTGATLPPSLLIGQADGTTIKTMLGAGAVTAHMFRGAAGPIRDGDIDTSVVSHEWGHYLHHRLASCGTGTQCNSMSEGWGDFDALLLLLRPTDDPHGTYSIGVYAAVTFGDAYFGIRRAPYSTNFSKNGFTFVDIGASAVLPTGFPIAFSGNNNEVHNAGEIWAGMMWETYVALIDADGYATARRAISNYVVAGLLMTPADATFTEQRDALLTAMHAVNPADAATAAAAFARRGAGSCAVSPARTSTTMDGVVESFTVSGVLGVGAITIDDDQLSCDHDHILDGGEIGTLRVSIVNSGPGTLSQTQIAVSTTTPGITIVGGTRTAAAVGPYSTGVEAFTIKMDPSVTTSTNIAIAVALTDSTACVTSASANATIRGEYDSTPNSSANDDVESGATVWTTAGSAGVWNREVIGTNYAWHGVDSGSTSDAQLVSPPLVVGNGAFTVGFSHRFVFDFANGPNGAHDGGVVEVSTDNGVTWADVTTKGATPGYNVTVSATGTNPLAGRQAYGHNSPGGASRNTVSLAFGTALAGQTVRLRFRIGTDAATSAYGWEIDDLTFAGITNTPFATTTAEGATCQVPPVASAGPDQTVFTGASVALDGTGSHDVDGDPLTYAWTQTQGPAVTLSGASTTTPSFTAPSSPTTLAFQIAVTDPWATTTDTVQVTVQSPPPPPDAMPIDAMPIDAARPDAMPIDAMPIDAARPDASPPDAAPAPDANTAPDAGPAPDARAIDAAPHGPPDAGTSGSPGGGCCSTGGSDGTGAGALALLLAVVLRRRRLL